MTTNKADIEAWLVVIEGHMMAHHGIGVSNATAHRLIATVRMLLGGRDWYKQQTKDEQQKNEHLAVDAEKRIAELEATVLSKELTNAELSTDLLGFSAIQTELMEYHKDEWIHFLLECGEYDDKGNLLRIDNRCSSTWRCLCVKYRIMGAVERVEEKHHRFYMTTKPFNRNESWSPWDE